MGKLTFGGGSCRPDRHGRGNTLFRRVRGGLSSCVKQRQKGGGRQDHREGIKLKLLRSGSWEGNRGPARRKDRGGELRRSKLNPGPEMGASFSRDLLGKKNNLLF